MARSDVQVSSETHRNESLNFELATGNWELIRFLFPATMPRFKMTLEYAGTRYSGWQKQKNARTVQGEIERAVAEVTGQRHFECQGSGRTDAGVHALMQVAHLDLNATLPPETLRRRLNDELPADVNVLTIAKAHHRFHARHSAVARSPPNV